MTSAPPMSSFLCSLVMNAKAILSFPDLASLSTVQHISVSVGLEDTDGFECIFTFYYLTMEIMLSFLSPHAFRGSSLEARKRQRN